MSLQVPRSVEKLKSFAELLSWAMQLWGSADGGLLDLVRRTANHTSQVEFSSGHHKFSLDFGNLPTSTHAQWFLRVGLMVNAGTLSSIDPDASRLPIDTRMPSYKAAGSAKDWYIGSGCGERYFGFFADALGLPREVELYLRDRYSGFHFVQKPKRFARVGFDADKVLAAVENSKGFLRDHPPIDRLTFVTETEPALELRFESERASRLLLTAQGHQVAACWNGEHVDLTRAMSFDPEVLVAPDVTLVAHVEDRRLQVTRINRVSAAVAAWPSQVDLSGLGNGEVLAIGAAGARDLGFVWASDGGTDLFRATPGEEVPTLRGRLSKRRATAAVLRGAQALLAVPERGRPRNGAFPNLNVETLTAAHSGGRLLVLATGTNADGQAVAAVEQDGRQVTELDRGDVFLTFDLARQTVPSPVTADGATVLLSPDDRPSEPYAHWLPHEPSRDASA